MSQIKEKIGKFSFVDTAAGQFALHMDWSSSMSQLFDLSGRNWDDDPVSVAGERVVPWGKDNNLPRAIRDLLERNNLGPALYRTVIENNERVQQWVEDADIQAWLDTWDYRGFVRAALVEYTHLNGVFVKYRMGRGVRIEYLVFDKWTPPAARPPSATIPCARSDGTCMPSPASSVRCPGWRMATTCPG